MKKITLFTLLTLLLCTSCVTKKKFMQAEMAATISKDSLQGLLTDCRNINASRFFHTLVEVCQRYKGEPHVAEI